MPMMLLSHIARDVGANEKRNCGRRGGERGEGQRVHTR